MNSESNPHCKYCFKGSIRLSKIETLVGLYILFLISKLGSIMLGSILKISNLNRITDLLDLAV